MLQRISLFLYVYSCIKKWVCAYGFIKNMYIRFKLITICQTVS